MVSFAQVSGTLGRRLEICCLKMILHKHQHNDWQTWCTYSLCTYSIALSMQDGQNLESSPKNQHNTIVTESNILW